MENNKELREKKQFDIHVVRGSISVCNGSRTTQKEIVISKNWANTEYYTIKDDGECLLIKKCYMEIPKNAYKLRRNNNISIEHSEIKNGKYFFDEDESDEDKAVVYYL
jgi:hypothetical protein